MDPDQALELIRDAVGDQLGYFTGRNSLIDRVSTVAIDALTRAGVFDAVMFCPRCEAVCDELTDEVLDDYERPPRPGPPFTCGWCKSEQTDWNHLERCRKLGENALEIRFIDAGRKLQAIVDGLAS